MFNNFLHRSPKKNALGTTPSLSLIKMHVLAADLQMLCTTDTGCLLFCAASYKWQPQDTVLSSKDTKNCHLWCLLRQNQLEWKHNEIRIKSFPRIIEKWSLREQGWFLQVHLPKILKIEETSSLSDVTAGIFHCYSLLVQSLDFLSEGLCCYVNILSTSYNVYFIHSLFTCYEMVTTDGKMLPCLSLMCSARSSLSPGECPTPSTQRTRLHGASWCSVHALTWCQF